MQDIMFHNNGPMRNNEITGFIQALNKVLNDAGSDINIKKKLFRKINKILLATPSEAEKFFLIACVVFDTYSFLFLNQFYDLAHELYCSLNKFVPQIFDQSAPHTPYQRYAVNRMERRLEILSGVMKNHEDCQSYKNLNACLENNQLTIFGKWGKLKRAVQSLPEKEKQDQYIIELCDAIDNDQILVPKFKLGFESLNKKLQDSFDQTSVAIRNKVKMLKETFGGQECTDLSSMVVPVLFQASMPPNIEQYLKSKTYVHNNRTVVNFKLIKTDAQSASQIVLSLIDIYMANIKCFKRYGIELHETSMIICMIEKLKSINNYTHNQDESELYVASLKKIAESCSGCIFVGADESCSEINKPTTIYSDAMIKYYHTFNKLYEYDGSEEERHNFAEIYAHIYAKNPKLSHKVFDVMPQYLQKAINIKPQREQSCSGRYLPKFFISQLNKENKNPDNNISAENNDLITKAQKRRTQSQ